MEITKKPGASEMGYAIRINSGITGPNIASDCVE